MLQKVLKVHSLHIIVHLTAWNRLRKYIRTMNDIPSVQFLHYRCSLHAHCHCGALWLASVHRSSETNLSHFFTSRCREVESFIMCSDWNYKDWRMYCLVVVSFLYIPTAIFVMSLTDDRIVREIVPYAYLFFFRLQCFYAQSRCIIFDTPACAPNTCTLYCHSPEFWFFLMWCTTRENSSTTSRNSHAATLTPRSNEIAQNACQENVGKHFFDCVMKWEISMISRSSRYDRLYAHESYSPLF